MVLGEAKLLLVYLLTHISSVSPHSRYCTRVHTYTCAQAGTHPLDVHTFASSLSELPESRWLLSCNPHAPVKPTALGSSVSPYLPPPRAWLCLSWGPVPGSLQRSAQRSHYSQVGGCENSRPLLKRLSTSSSLITVMLASLALNSLIYQQAICRGRGGRDADKQTGLRCLQDTCQVSFLLHLQSSGRKRRRE